MCARSQLMMGVRMQAHKLAEKGGLGERELQNGVCGMIGQCGIPLKAFPTAGSAAQNKQSTFLGIEKPTHSLLHLHLRRKFCCRFCSTILLLFYFFPGDFSSVS